MYQVSVLVPVYGVEKYMERFAEVCLNKVVDICNVEGKSCIFAALKVFREIFGD